MSQYPHYNYNPDGNPNGTNYQTPAGQHSGSNGNYPMQQPRPNQSSPQGYGTLPAQHGHLSHYAQPQSQLPYPYQQQQQQQQQQYARQASQSYYTPTPNTQPYPQQPPVSYPASPHFSHQQIYSSPSQPQVIIPPPQRSSASQAQPSLPRQPQQQYGGWNGHGQASSGQMQYNQGFPPQQSYHQLYQQPQPGYTANHLSTSVPMAVSQQPQAVSPRVQVQPQQPKPSVQKPPKAPTPQQSSRPLPQPPSVQPITQPPPPPPQVQQPLDYKVLLLSLAGEYIDAAHSIGTQVVLYGDPKDAENYHKLIATGLGCIAATLKIYRHPPRDEAVLSLHYASLLLEETDNRIEIDEILTKQIAKTNQAKSWDLKYSMQYLQIQALHRSNAKAALKSLDNIVVDATRLSHFPWVYAFRFLRISLSVKLLEQGQDANATLQNVLHIESLAEKLDDDAVYVLAATIEAMLHLRMGNLQCYEEAQRAIAKARSRQLKLHKSLDHLWLLVDCVDATCHFMTWNIDRVQQCTSALENIAKNLQTEGDGTPKWPHDGVLLVPLRSGYDQHVTDFSDGVFQRNSAGRDLLRVAWVPHREFSAMVQLLLGISGRLKRNYTAQEGLASLQKGIRWAADGLEGTDGRVLVELPASISVRSATETSLQRHKIEMMLQVRALMAHATAGRWDAADKHLRLLVNASTDSKSSQLQPWIEFSTAVIRQGTGHLEEALAIYEDPIFALSLNPTSKLPTVKEDLSILATIHAITIRSGQYYDPTALDRIMQIEALTARHPNQSLRSAVHMTRTVLMDAHAHVTSTNDPARNSLSKRKLSLQEALNAAKFSGDSQMLALIMSLLTTMLFRGVMGEQANKMAKTASTLAKALGNPLLGSVADGLVVEFMEQQGDAKEVVDGYKDVIRAGFERVPAMVKTRITGSMN